MSSRPFWGPPNLLSNMWGGGLSAVVKRPGLEADHSPTANDEVQKMWVYTATPPYAFMAQCLIS
jgi:isochorismate hydrolase